MHIGFLTSEYPTTAKPEGGLANYIRKVGLELIQRGHEVTVFILAARQHSEIDRGINLYFVKRFKFHWRLHRINVLHSWLSLYEQWHDAQHLKKVVLRSNKTKHIDILQTPNYKTPGLALCHNRHFPIICRCSSYQPLWRSANGDKGTLTDAISDWLEAKQVIDAEAAFSPSELIAHIYERFEAIKPIVIRTPIDFSVVNQDSSTYLQYLDGKKYLLFVGTLNGVKGVDVLIDATKEILLSFHDIDVVFIGRNDVTPSGKRGVDLLKQVIGDLYNQNRVMYFPPLPRSQLYPIIQNAFGVVLPSRVDNYPNICLEALTLGVPVVGTYNSSLDEMIEHEITGYLAKNGDSLSLAAAISRVLVQTPQQRTAMVKAIQLKIKEIEIEDPITKLLNYYQKISDAFSKNI